MWRLFMIFGTVFFGLGALCGFLAAGFAVVERDWRSAGIAGLGALILAGIARACRADWIRERQKGEGEDGTRFR